MNQEPTALANLCQTSHPQGSVLALNAGSSSLKFALFGGGAVPVRVLSGAIDRIGSPDATFTLKQIKDRQAECVVVSAPNHAGCLDYLLKRLAETTEATGFRPTGHRVVLLPGEEVDWLFCRGARRIGHARFLWWHR